MQQTGARNDPTTGVTPYLTVSDGPAAMAFYTKAFGGKENFRQIADDGKRILHGQIQINGATVMVSDHFAEHSGGAPAPTPAAMLLHLPVSDADLWWNRAIDAGATVVQPLADQFWGDRWGMMQDPFGHRWSVSTPVKK